MRTREIRKVNSGKCLPPFENRVDYGTHFRMLQIIMKKQFLVLVLAALAIALFALTPQASAHERDTFKIGDKYYVFTVGSLNEPFVVDNQSGVDFRVSLVAGPGSAKGTPVTGLDRTLKVELIAGNKKETLSFDPSDEAPGSYTANFIPTVQTTYSYRIFGTLSSIPIDLTFACVPGEVSETAEDNSQVKVSGVVTRLNKIGAFSCPAAREALGFPEPARSSYELDQNTKNLAAAAQMAGKQATTAQTLSIIALIVGLSGLAVAGIAWKRK